MPGRLADDREILYFFDDEARASSFTPPADPRPLPPRPEPGELRFDELSGEWTAIAAHRQTRTYLPPADQCPLCPSGHAGADGTRRESEIPAADYDVVVFENRFPSLGPIAGAIPAHPHWGEPVPATGRCEVVAFTSEHTGSFATLPLRRARTVLDAWAERTAALSALPGIAQVFVFENRGAQIGVTLHHPHGQIYAYPYVTPRGALLGERAAAHLESTGTLLGERLLLAEQREGSRVITMGEHFTSYVPWAARWPLEVHISAHRHVGRLDELTDAEREDAARVYLDTLNRLDHLYDSPTPYIAAWNQAPADPRLRAASWLHLQVTSPRRAADKLKFLAGSEAAMGAFINDTVPEQVAERLRSVSGEPTAPAPAPASAAVSVPTSAAASAARASAPDPVVDR
ncbi:galactose-1-phosphate uridylyltransferase [Tersicoccus sp. Bi-70]|nr:galactose-1-phosphate uridylyltransferase [Tersicoccus sp. Bi-70]